MIGHVLLAIHDSESSKKAVEYVAAHLSRDSDARITIYSVVRTGTRPQHIGAMYASGPIFPEGEELFKSEDEYERMQDKHARTLLGQARKRLSERFPGRGPEIHTEIDHTTEADIASVIAEKADRDHYDSVVVGRNDHSSVENLVSGNVTRGLLDRLKGHTAWVVG